MKQFIVAITAAIATSCIACPTSDSAEQALKELRTLETDVAWDASSIVCGDFDGDGSLDQAILGYRNRQVLVAIRRILPGPRKVKPQILEFEVDRGLQAAICDLPAKLIVGELICGIEDGALPGCKEKRGTKSLDLSDEQCDSVHMYWSHSKGSMVWWRR